MPVRFQGSSEYARNYQWHEYYKNRNNASTGQIGHVAGLSSDKIGLVSEPAIRYRKMADYDYREPYSNRDEYILLGDQSKFGNSVKYPLKYFRNYPSQKDLDTSANNNNRKDASPPKRSPPPAPRPADPPAKSHTVKAASYQTSHQNRPKKPNQTVPSKPVKHATIVTPKPNQSSGKPVQRPTVNSQPPKKVDDFAQTDLDLQEPVVERPPVDADYAMKYRAKIAPPRPKGPKRMSEYQMQYKWFDNVDSSPLLAAEQVVYKSNSVLSGAKDVVPKESVYKQEFKPWKYTTVAKMDPESQKHKVMERSKSLESLTAAGVEKRIPADNRRLVKESLNPHRLFFPHGKYFNYTTEYSKNFQPFTGYEYENGAWQGAPHPQDAWKRPPVVPEKTSKPKERPVSASAPSHPSAHSDTSWFAEVRELRRRAAEYRQRSRGTHFSRDHLAQLYARQADLWDTVSNSSSLSALSLENTKKLQAKEKVRSSPDRPPAGIRTAWDQRDQTAPKILTARTHTISSDSSSSSMSSSSSPSDETPVLAQPSTASSSTEGRVPTPKIRVKPVKSTLLRHHLDRTTPAVGGALLTSPPKKKDQGSDTTASPQSPRPVASETRSEPIREVVRTQPAQTARSASMLYGLPTRDTHLLVDEEASEDRALETRYTRSPPQPRDPVARRLEYREKHPELSIPSTINEGGTAEYQNGHDNDNDDVLSTSARSVASSSSLASEVLERARNRRDEFWGSSARN